MLMLKVDDFRYNFVKMFSRPNLEAQKRMRNVSIRARTAVAMITVAVLMKMTANIWPIIRRISGMITTPPIWLVSLTLATLAEISTTMLMLNIVAKGAAATIIVK